MQLVARETMSFEDVENLKTTFKIYDIPARPASSTTPKTFMMLQKRNITPTRIIVTPPVYGAKHHFKMLIFSLFSKIGLEHA